MPLGSRALVQAVLAHLRADPKLGAIVHFGSVEGSQDTDQSVYPPYVVVYADTGDSSRERMSSEQTTRVDVTFTVQAVGADADQALWWADVLNGRMLDFKPQVPGWKCQALRHDGSDPIDRITEFTPPVSYSSDDYVLTARRS